MGLGRGSPSDVSSYIIYAGRYQLNGFNPHQSAHRVSQVVIPSGYVEPHSGKDLVLVQLSSPVTWSDRVHPICLPASGSLFPGGMQCYVTGPFARTRDSTGSAGANHLPEFMSGDVPDAPDRESGHLV
ncbi:hypothetical protein PAMP_010381 [Pampus punctatissimus]